MNQLVLGNIPIYVVRYYYSILVSYHLHIPVRQYVVYSYYILLWLRGGQEAVLYTNTKVNI